MRWVMRCSVVMLHGNRGVLGATLCAAVASRVRLICDMRAIRLHGYNDIRFEDIPVPEPADGDALIEVSRTSICATDIEVWQSPLRFGGDDDGPLVMGHEIGGTVVDVRGDADIAPGTRVVVNNVLTCRECFWCIRGSQATCPKMRVAGLSADGGLAEYLAWPSTHVVPLSNEVDDDVAPLLEPTTVAVHAARRSGIKPGDKVAVLGCGTVGMLTVQVAAAAGAFVIAVDVREQSLELAQQLGASATVDASNADVAEALRDLTDGIGPDIVFEASGVPSVPPTAIAATRPGGATVLVGIYGHSTEFDFSDIVLGEKTVIGTVAAGPGDMAAARSMVESGAVNVKPLITDVIRIERAIPDGFERMLKPQKDVYRIVVSPRP